MKYVLFGHAGSGNHGCEAIVRTTCKILGNNDYYLQTLNIEEDEKFGLHKLVKPIMLKEKTVKRNSFLGLAYRIKSRLKKENSFDTILTPSDMERIIHYLPIVFH